MADWETGLPRRQPKAPWDRDGPKGRRDWKDYLRERFRLSRRAKFCHFDNIPLHDAPDIRMAAFVFVDPDRHRPAEFLWITGDESREGKALGLPGYVRGLPSVGGILLVWRSGHPLIVSPKVRRTRARYTPRISSEPFLSREGPPGGPFLDRLIGQELVYITGRLTLDNRAADQPLLRQFIERSVKKAVVEDLVEDVIGQGARARGEATLLLFKADGPELRDLRDLRWFGPPVIQLGADGSRTALDGHDLGISSPGPGGGEAGPPALDLAAGGGLGGGAIYAYVQIGRGWKRVCPISRNESLGLFLRAQERVVLEEKEGHPSVLVTESARDKCLNGVFVQWSALARREPLIWTVLPPDQFGDFFGDYQLKCTDGAWAFERHNIVRDLIRRIGEMPPLRETLDGGLVTVDGSPVGGRSYKVVWGVFPLIDVPVVHVFAHFPVDPGLVLINCAAPETGKELASYRDGYEPAHFAEWIVRYDQAAGGRAKS